MIGPARDVDESFASFVSTRSARLIAHAYLLCGNSEQARDIVQNVLVRAYPRWHRIEREDPYGYIAAAVSNAVTDWWRIAHRRHERSTDTLPEHPADAAYGTVEDQQTLLVALGALTKRERAVVVLRYLDDRTEAEVAHLLQVRIGTVKATCHKALRKMRQVLDEEQMDVLRNTSPEGKVTR